MTRHDDHYAKMAIQPIEVMEQVAANAKDPIAGLRVAMACKYILRAGTKEEWGKDIEKASNYLYRALHGAWPWDAVTEIEIDFGQPCPKIPPRDSGRLLLDRDCWVWQGNDTHLAKRMRITNHDETDSSFPYLGKDDTGHNWNRHAQPVELGHPSPDHPEYRGEI